MIQLRAFQKNALKHLEASAVHLICTSPTGSGKGVILEKIGENPEERVLLITPLIALARQQALRFENRGIPILQTLGEVETLNTGTQSRIWIMSPEKLSSEHYRKQVLEWKPTLIAVDECHCIWEWGNSGFRPEYQKLPEFVLNSKLKRSLWMSATLPSHCFEDLTSRLNNAPIQHVGEFSLPINLRYRIQKTRYQNRLEHLLHFLSKNQDRSGIIFALSRKTCESLHRTLSQYGINTAVYHAGLFKEERVHVESRLNGGEKLIVLATSAFGLGMDFKSLDFVSLYQPTFNLLSLVQSIGRVGRSHPGEAVVYYHEEDFRVLENTFSKTESARKEIKDLYSFLSAPEEGRDKILRSYFK